MKEKSIGICYIFYVQQLHFAVSVGVEVFVHVLQNVLYAYLFAVPDAPNRIELQPFNYRRLQDEYSCSAATRYEICA